MAERVEKSRLIEFKYMNEIKGEGLAGNENTDKPLVVYSMTIHIDILKKVIKDYPSPDEYIDSVCSYIKSLFQEALLK